MKILCKLLFYFYFEIQYVGDLHIGEMISHNVWSAICVFMEKDFRSQNCKIANEITLIHLSVSRSSNTSSYVTYTFDVAS